MRAYTRAKLILTKFKSVSVSVSLGEINSENKNGACKFFLLQGYFQEFEPETELRPSI